MILNEYGWEIFDQKKVIIGTGGFAKELFSEIIFLPETPKYNIENLHYFNNIDSNVLDPYFKGFKIIKSFEEFNSLITDDTDWNYILGIGSPINRRNFVQQMEKFVPEALIASFISDYARIGADVEMDKGVTIMQGTIVTSDIKIGKGVLLNINCTVGHDCIIGDYVEISPAVNISGKCKIGNFCSIGTNATLIPNITLGNNVIVGAGAVVTKDVPDNSLVVGVPAKVIKQLTPIE